MNSHKLAENILFGYIYAHSNKRTKAKPNPEAPNEEHAAKSSTSGYTISELSHLWLERKRIRVKESTYIKYNNILSKYALPYIGDVFGAYLFIQCINTSNDPAKIGT